MVIMVVPSATLTLNGLMTLLRVSTQSSDVSIHFSRLPMVPLMHFSIRRLGTISPPGELTLELVLAQRKRKHCYFMDYAAYRPLADKVPYLLLLKCSMVYLMPSIGCFLNGPFPASFSFIFIFSSKHYNFYNK